MCCSVAHLTSTEAYGQVVSLAKTLRGGRGGVDRSPRTPGGEVLLVTAPDNLPSYPEGDAGGEELPAALGTVLGVGKDELMIEVVAVPCRGGGPAVVCPPATGEETPCPSTVNQTLKIHYQYISTCRYVASFSLYSWNGCWN